MVNPFAKFRKKVEEAAPIPEEKKILEPEDKPVEGKPEEVKEAEKTEEIEVETKSEEPEEIEVTPEVEEPKKVEKKRTRKVTKKAPEPESEIEVEHVPLAEAEQSLKDYNKLKDRLLFAIDDPKYDEFKEDIDKRLREDLNISSDINDGSARIYLATLDQIHTRVCPYKHEIDAMAKTLSDLKKLQEIANSIGSSAEIRKKAGNKACLEFLLDKKSSPINLFGIDALLRSRIAWVNSVMDVINFKREILRGFLSIMRREE